MSSGPDGGGFAAPEFHSGRLFDHLETEPEPVVAAQAEPVAPAAEAHPVAPAAEAFPDDAFPEDILRDDAPPRPARAAKASGPNPDRAPKKRPEWLLDSHGLDALLEGLNGPQREAVVHSGGPLLVVAGAGSGKTRVLTRRIAYLVGSGQVAPWQVLAITFTNKAADEMRGRVRELLGEVADRMWVSTFHSACVRILRSQADRLGYRKSFTIYDDADSRRLI